VSELLYFIIFSSYKNQKQTSIEDFIAYMNKKYSFIDTSYFLKTYSKKDVRNKINKILCIFQKYIPEVDTSYKL
jgi:hypothetical protein